MYLLCRPVVEVGWEVGQKHEIVKCSTLHNVAFRAINMEQLIDY